MTKYTCKSVHFEKVNEETRVGYGRPYTSTWESENGTRKVYKDVGTFRDPAPSVGDTEEFYY